MSTEKTNFNFSLPFLSISYYFFLNFKKLETKTHVHREPPPSFRHKFGQIMRCGIKKMWRNKVVFFGTCPTNIGPMVWTKNDLKTNCLRKMPSEELCQQEHLSVLLCLSSPHLHSSTPHSCFLSLQLTTDLLPLFHGQASPAAAASVEERQSALR